MVSDEGTVLIIGKQHLTQTVQIPKNITITTPERFNQQQQQQQQQQKRSKRNIAADQQYATITGDGNVEFAFTVSKHLKVVPLKLVMSALHFDKLGVLTARSDVNVVLDDIRVVDSPPIGDRPSVVSLSQGSIVVSNSVFINSTGIRLQGTL